MTKVISYTRFSSKKQDAGDSKHRQDTLALKWCAANGHELDLAASIHDPGYSAYSGAHLKHGALGVLRMACLNGEIEPGTILLIENFDRLTRLPLPEAYELLLSLLNNGLTVVTLTDGRTWSNTSMRELESFMLSLLQMYRGFDESDRKASMLQQAFEAARNTNDKSAFGSAPGWLYRESKDSPWQVHEGLADIVREVFQMSAAGYGSKAIAKRANENHWPVPTRLNLTQGRWHARMPGLILRNRAVIGEHEHRLHTQEARRENYRGTSTGLIRPDYYPRIVSDELWNAARASIETRRAEKRRDTHYYNIFSGVMYCGHCGAPIHRRTETRGYSRATLACADKVAGLTQCPSSAAVTADAPLLEAIFTHKPQAKNSEAVERELATIDADVREKTKELSNITDTIAKVGPLDPLTEKLSMLSLELEICKVARETLVVSIANNYSQPDYLPGVVEEAIRQLYIADAEAQDFRANLNLRIRRLVDTIWLWGYEVAVIRFKGDAPGQEVIVPLDYKRLPSRANTLAKWHKPPKPKNPPARPHLESALAGTINTPVPRRAA